MEVVCIDPSEKAISAAKLLTDYFLQWDNHFPNLHRRSHWNIVRLLMNEGWPDGIFFRQIANDLTYEFHTDDGTSKKRVLECVRAGLARIEDQTNWAGEVRRLTKGTTIYPTNELARRYHEHQWEFACTVGNHFQRSFSIPRQDDFIKAEILRALDGIQAAHNSYTTTLVRSLKLTKARSEKAHIALKSYSHWTICHQTLLEGYRNSARDEDGGSTPVPRDRIVGYVMWRYCDAPDTVIEHTNDLIAWGILESHSSSTARRRPHIALTRDAKQRMTQFLMSVHNELEGLTARLSNSRVMESPT